MQIQGASPQQKAFALGDGPDIEVGEGEAILYVDGFADQVSGNDGWFWRLSDGDRELQAGGFTAPLPEEQQSLGGQQKGGTRGSTCACRGLHKNVSDGS